MQKPLKEFASSLKNVIQSIPQNYAISPIFKSIADEETIRSGVLAFRDFLCQFFDYVIAVADLYDKPKPNANRVWGGINFTMDYPFLRDMAMVLMNLGLYGEFNKNGDALVLSGGELLSFSKKTRVSKPAVYLRHLTECGIEVLGIDLDTEKPNLSSNSTLEISYPDNPVMLIGLKAMANAQLEANKKRFKPGSSTCITLMDNIFLRCDYKALGEEKTEHITLIKDAAKPFPAGTQELALKLHRRLTDFGFKCEMENRRFGSMGNFFLYSCNKGVHKRKSIEDIWIIRLTHTDCGIRFNAKNADKYMDFIENLPTPLLDIIKTGDGCVCNPTPKKCRENWIPGNGASFLINGQRYTKCNTKCCAECDYWIPLTDLTDEVEQAIVNWIDIELSYS